MYPTSLSRRHLLAGVGGLALVAAGCSNNDPLTGGDGGGSGGGEGGPLVIGSQQYYSNEIIAELYAQILEAAGREVDRQYQIGQREVYLPELESGRIDLLPEYGGNLLQYFDDQTSATTSEEIQAALAEVAPAGLRVLPYAAATDQDAYVCTQAFSEEHGLTSLADLAGAGVDLVVAANSEFGTRPYGPDGLQSVYGASATLLPVEDSGGPLTVKALLDGDANLADIYTASPVIDTENLVVLEDPESLILPQNVTPLVSERIDDEAAAAIQTVTDLLTLEALREMNARSVNDQANSEVIAKDWLEANGLL
ncbi:ABC transporter substrate-binding protein [Parenemella sanctibonifatiensis]|uniref:Glycine/betaine ABC transporter n=1 Tax=Parenemella sanctibonifatiensis TaxID=2016505 RepID=A0A255E0R6_9ACTN|nr:ABC transporter substrate-binding protein [Parenemella sanctibonifatiensis]OYN84601.1 glycine/betaine ABC transporter [Parenemella sanctibonifatiensis]